MGRRRWLERVADELAGRGLPARVRARLLAELRDHLDDLTEGEADMATEADVASRMGAPGELAAAAAAEYRRAGWVRRHPALVFGAAPVPAAVLAVVIYLLLLAAVGYALAAAGVGDPAPGDRFARAAVASWHGLGFVPFLAAAAGFGWLAVRARVGWWWLAAALVQVALLGGVVRTDAALSDLPGQSQVLVGFGLPLAGWRQAAQLLFPLAAGWLAVRFAGHHRPPAVA